MGELYWNLTTGSGHHGTVQWISWYQDIMTDSGLGSPSVFQAWLLCVKTCCEESYIGLCRLCQASSLFSFKLFTAKKHIVSPPPPAWRYQNSRQYSQNWYQRGVDTVMVSGWEFSERMTWYLLSIRVERRNWCSNWSVSSPGFSYGSNDLQPGEIESEPVLGSHRSAPITLCSHWLGLFITHSLLMAES